MTFLEIYGIAALVILGYMALLWIVSLIMKDSSIVDIFWGAGFVLANWVYFAFTPDGSAARKWLVSILVTIWGLRLSLYILWRNWGEPEDFRYRKWREEEGERWWWFSFFKVFLLQGILMWIISAPLLAAQIQPPRVARQLLAGHRVREHPARALPGRCRRRPEQRRQRGHEQAGEAGSGPARSVDVRWVQHDLILVKSPP